MLVILATGVPGHVNDAGRGAAFGQRLGRVCRGGGNVLRGRGEGVGIEAVLNDGRPDVSDDLLARLLLVGVLTRWRRLALNRARLDVPKVMPVLVGVLLPSGRKRGGDRFGRSSTNNRLIFVLILRQHK